MDTSPSKKTMTPVQRLHAVVAAIAAAFVALVVAANVSCAPTYFERADVLLMLALAVVFAVALAWAALADSDVRRVVGSLSSAGVVGLFVGTASIPLLFTPLALVGAARLARQPALRRAGALAAVLVAIAGFVLPYLGQSAMSSDEFRCP
jgi:hypothetical protein